LNPNIHEYHELNGNENVFKIRQKRKIDFRNERTIQIQIQNPKSSLPARVRRARVWRFVSPKSGFQVCLIEREKFPRHKLCGEFISPECLRHFRRTRRFGFEMLAAGGERIVETVFYAANGKNVRVPSEWFGGAGGALSLSRAEMDFRLTEKAKAVGVEFLEETQIVGVFRDEKKVCGVKAKNKDGETFEIAADLFVDATGRANVLGKLAEKSKIQDSKPEIQNPKSKIQNRLVGFKTHLEKRRARKKRCEIYFFRGGYGGLSQVENGLANHCFLIKAERGQEIRRRRERNCRKSYFSKRTRPRND
jgi:flavin-dependent dehydrogenase